MIAGWVLAGLDLALAARLGWRVWLFDRAYEPTGCTWNTRFLLGDRWYFRWLLNRALDDLRAALPGCDCDGCEDDPALDEEEGW